MFLLFVDPAHAGRGIGRTLLDASHEVLREAGCREAYSIRLRENEHALAMYAAAGYRPDGSDSESDFRGTPIRGSASSSSSESRAEIMFTSDDPVRVSHRATKYRQDRDG